MHRRGVRRRAGRARPEISDRREDRGVRNASVERRTLGRRQYLVEIVRYVEEGQCLPIPLRRFERAVAIKFSAAIGITIRAVEGASMATKISTIL